MFTNNWGLAIVSSFPFRENINSENHRFRILDLFINQLRDNELEIDYFEQDGASPHATFDILRYPKEYFWDKVMYRNHLPLHQPHVT